MKQSDLDIYLTAGFWQSSEIIAFPELPFDLEHDLLPTGSLLFQTSGSSGSKKWVIHTKNTLVESAQYVVDHLDITSADKWLLALPIHHVGGFGILARSHCSGCSVVPFLSKWSAIEAVKVIFAELVTVCSFVPTQIVDIVDEALICPESVRAVVVGGGRLSEDIKSKAIGLGWPILESYGMTETGSQIATQLCSSDEGLSVIEGWDVKTTDDGILEVKGMGLMKGYLSYQHGKFEIIKPFDEMGWFKTSDKIEILEEPKRVKFIRRNDRVIKILGEQVDLDSLELELKKLTERDVLIVAVPHERRGFALYPIVEGGLNDILAASLLELNGLKRLEVLSICDAFPRNEMGKLDRIRLRELVVILD